MQIEEQMDITIDSSLLGAFRDMPMEMYKVFREFIDNSLQSYIDNKEKLDAIPNSPKKCVVNISWEKDEITIVDNAWGMDHDAFARALKLNKKSEKANENDRLSRFGWGLKTAACYASRDYIIDSAAYGSKRHYHTEMDIDYIEQYAPPKNKTIISDCLPSEHGTKIRLKKINKNCAYSSNTEKKVRKKLERIYGWYIADGFLEITINNRPIIPVDPVLYKLPETGSEAMHYFSNHDGFEFQGKKYRYEGWVGILKTGDSSGDSSGFHYYQARRCVVFSDHPSVLFGKANDARFQHVIAEIELLGNEWPITTNKDAIQWGDQGLKEQFIADLMKEAEVKKIFDIAKKTKFRQAKPGSSELPENPTAPSDTNPTDPCSPSDSTAEPTVVPTTPTVQPVKTTVTKKIVYKERNYKMDITSFDDDPDRDFIKLKASNSKTDETKIEVEVNLSAPFLSEYVSSAQSQKLLYVFVEAFALSRVEAVKQGLQLNDSFAMESVLNEIMRKAR